MILFSGAAICGDHPHLRGEYNRTTCNRKYHIGSPPLARGILNRERIGQRRGGITPACAGNTCAHHSRSDCTWDHPRLRGEYSPKCIPDHIQTGSPPLARGILNRERIGQRRGGITPACAGNTCAHHSRSDCTWDHPRLRGEYSPKCIPDHIQTGSPPLARGILPDRAGQAISPGITPACAGNTLKFTDFITLYEDHPRLRGEYRTAGM